MKRIVILVVLSAVTAFAQQEFEQEYIQPAGNFSEIYIDCPAGRIYCEAAEGNEIEVYVKKLVYKNDDIEAKELADACKIEFKENRQVLEVIVQLPRRGYSKRGLLNKIFTDGWHEDLEIMIKAKLPPGIKLGIETASADVFAADLKNNTIDINGSSSDISLEDLQGDCIIDVSSGDLDAFRVDGNIDFSGSSSDFEIQDIKGNVRVSTSSGDGTIEKVSGDLDLKTSSGDIHLYGLQGDLYFSSTSGDCTAENIAGSVRAGSTSGTINLKQLSDPQGRFSAETTSGDVYLEITDAFEGELELDSNSGDISSQLDMSRDSRSRNYVSGTVGSGKGRIEIETTSGDIVLETYR